MRTPTTACPEGVAKVIAFVLSDEADYLRGGIRTR